MVWLVWYGLVWFGMGGRGQMTIEFIHEEISIMDYNGLTDGHWYLLSRYCD